MISPLTSDLSEIRNDALHLLRSLVMNYPNDELSELLDKLEKADIFQQLAHVFRISTAQDDRKLIISFVNDVITCALFTFVFFHGSRFICSFIHSNPKLS